jgi:hypothetical protein
MADQPRERAAVLQRRFEFAVVDVEHHALDAEDLVRLVHLGLAPFRQRPARFAPVADVTIRDGDEEHVMPLLRPQRGGAADLDLAIIRMRAEGNDAQLAVVRRHLDAGNLGEGGRGAERQDRDGEGGEERSLVLHGWMGFGSRFNRVMAG